MTLLPCIDSCGPPGKLSSLVAHPAWRVTRTVCSVLHDELICRSPVENDAAGLAARVVDKATARSGAYHSWPNNIYAVELPTLLFVHSNKPVGASACCDRSTDSIFFTAQAGPEVQHARPAGVAQPADLLLAPAHPGTVHSLPCWARDASTADRQRALTMFERRRCEGQERSLFELAGASGRSQPLGSMTLAVQKLNQIEALHTRSLPASVAPRNALPFTPRAGSSKLQKIHSSMYPRVRPVTRCGLGPSAGCVQAETLPSRLFPELIIMVAALYPIACRDLILTRCSAGSWQERPQRSRTCYQCPDGSALHHGRLQHSQVQYFDNKVFYSRGVAM